MARADQAPTDKAMIFMSKRRPRRSTLLLGTLLALMSGISGVLALSGSGDLVEPNLVYTVSDAGALNNTKVVSSPDAASLGAEMSISGMLDVAGRPANLCSLTNPAGCGEPWAGAYDLDSLPAWRWRNIDLDMDTSGGWSKAVQNAFKHIPVTIAEIFFNAANFLWMLLLFLMKMGFDAKGLLGFGAQSINTGAAFMSDKLLYFAIPLSAYVMWKFLKDFIKMRSGNPFGLMRRFGVFAVFLGLMWMVSTSSKQAITQNVNDPAAQLEQVGTLPWMAKEILNFADMAVAPLAGVVLDVDATTTPADESIGGKGGNLEAGPNLTLPGNAGNNGSATCKEYIQTIYSNYARGEDSERALIIVSKLWEGTFYQALKSASFGEPTVYNTPGGGAYASDIPDRVMCHYQDAVNDISPQTQQAIARIAYGEAVPAADKLGNVPLVFLTGNVVKKDDQRKAMVAWAACRWDGSKWDGQPEFAGAHKNSGSVNPFDDLCTKVMQEPGGKWNDNFWIFGSGIPDAVSQGDAVHQAQLKAARTWALGYSGANAGGRMIGAFIAFIVALLFLYCFGLLALGLTMSMMIAVALLALALPAALVLAAIGKTKQATPLFKMTLYSVLGHAFLTALLSLVVIISGIFQNLLGSFSGLPLMIRSLTTGLAPVIAFLIVRKLMKSVGMGDIMSPLGALSFAGGAALSGGGKMSANAQKSLTSGALLKKTPGLGKRLDRLDGMAPTWKNWSPDGRRKRLATTKKEDDLERKNRQKKIDGRASAARDKRREQLAAQMRLEGHDPNTKMGQAELEDRLNKDIADRALAGRNAAGRARVGLLDKIDKARMPGSVKDRLKSLAHDEPDVLPFLGKGAGLAALAVMGPAAWVAAGLTVGGVNGYRRLGDDVARGAAIDYLDAGGRPPGAPVSAGTEPHDSFSPGAATSGPGTVDARAASGRDAGHLKAAVNGYEKLIDTLFTDIAASHGVGTGSDGWSTDGKVTRIALSEGDRERIAVKAAVEFGCEPSMVLTTPGGIVVPTPAMGEARQSLENTEHGLGHFVHWLPEEDQERRPIPTTKHDGSPGERQESASEQAARLMVQGWCRGAVGNDGQLIDVRSLALPGADMSNDDVRAQIDAWCNGAVDDRLSNFRLEPADPDEEKLIQAAYERVRAEECIVVERTLRSESTDKRSDEADRGAPIDGAALEVLKTIADGVNRTADGVGRVDIGIGNLRGQVERVAVSMDAARSPAGVGSSAAASGVDSGAPRAATPPEANAVEIAESVKQLMIAVNAARELFANAKASGNDAKIGEAAGTLSTVMSAFSEQQGKLMEAHGHDLISGFSTALLPLRDTITANTESDGFTRGALRDVSGYMGGLNTALRNHGASVDNMSGRLQRLTTEVEEGLGRLGNKLAEFTSGAISLEAAVTHLDETMRASAVLTNDAAVAVQRAIADVDKSGGQQMREARTGKQPYTAQSASDVAKRSKAEPIPDEG